jgi:hypothetical protein
MVNKCSFALGDPLIQLVDAPAPGPHEPLVFARDVPPEGCVRLIEELRPVRGCGALVTKGIELLLHDGGLALKFLRSLLLVE